MTTPNSRTKEFFTARGYQTDKVEATVIIPTRDPRAPYQDPSDRTGPGYRMISRDYLGIIDLLAFTPGRPGTTNPTCPNCKVAQYRTRLEETATEGALVTAKGLLPSCPFHGPQAAGQFGLQACINTDMANRLKKALGNEVLPTFLACPWNRFLVVGWALKGGVGTRKLWTPRFWEIIRDPGTGKTLPLTPTDSLT